MNCFQRLWIWRRFPRSILSTRTGGGRFRLENVTTGKVFIICESLKVQIVLSVNMRITKKKEKKREKKPFLMKQWQFGLIWANSFWTITWQQWAYRELVQGSRGRSLVVSLTRNWFMTDLGQEPGVFIAVCLPGCQSVTYMPHIHRAPYIGASLFVPCLVSLRTHDTRR